MNRRRRENKRFWARLTRDRELERLRSQLSSLREENRRLRAVEMAAKEELGWNWYQEKLREAER